tara:strand:- start:1951 stop:2250 length:300 start_codon:yes stop_codon:yes gene_type:complete
MANYNTNNAVSITNIGDFITTAKEITFAGADTVVELGGNPNNGSLIYVGESGDVEVQLKANPEGTWTLFTKVATGTFLPILATKIRATNTTAQSLLAVM